LIKDVFLACCVFEWKGSHVHLRHPVRPPLTIPAHKEMARGTLRAIIKQAGFSLDEFLKLLKR
jgi:hypothetical protein